MHDTENGYTQNTKASTDLLDLLFVLVLLLAVTHNDRCWTRVERVIGAGFDGRDVAGGWNRLNRSDGAATTSFSRLADMDRYRNRTQGGGAIRRTETRHQNTGVEIGKDNRRRRPKKSTKKEAQKEYK